jgi:hypothetical protein
MIQRHECFVTRAAAKVAAIAAVLATVVLASLPLPADARGGAHGSVGHVAHGAQFGGGRRHANDSYVKAASEERDKFLNTQVKSICRGC